MRATPRIARVGFAPLLNTRYVRAPFKMVRVFGEPELLTNELSSLSTLRFVTKVLAVAVAQVWEKWRVTVPADFRIRWLGHRPPNTQRHAGANKARDESPQCDPACPRLPLPEWSCPSKLCASKLVTLLSKNHENRNNNTFTIAVSGTFTIARDDLESLLRGTMAKERDGEQRDTQPKIEVAQPKPATKDFGPPQRLTLSMKETADVLGVSYITVQRLTRSGSHPDRCKVSRLTNPDSAETIAGMFPTVYCPSCNRSMPGPFPLAGCVCGFSLSGLAGKGTSAFQINKDAQHRDILSGRDIQLYGKPLNTSFDFYGDANLIDVVDFALTYGEKRSIMSLHGKYPTNVIVSYIPDVIGSGIQKVSPSGLVQPCSGICLMSPESTAGFEHSFAALDDWVSKKFSGDSSVCKFCKKITPFGLGICVECFEKNGERWQNFIDATFTIKLL